VANSCSAQVYFSVSEYTGGVYETVSVEDYSIPMALRRRTLRRDELLHALTEVTR
jgi:hypothetical protein